ncbi:hypothetical protein ES703_50583 [subsurface metagenome]
MSDVVAKPNPLIQILDSFIGTGRRRINFIPRSMIVNGHLDIVFLNLPVNQRQQFRFRDLHSRSFSIIKSLMHLVLASHIDYSAAVKLQPRIFNLLHYAAYLRGTAVQRKMKALESNVFQTDPFGHRQCVIQVELS